MSFRDLAGMFPMNVPMTGHTVPGQAAKYPSKTVTFHDNTTDPLLVKDLAVNPVKPHMDMQGDHTTKHPMLQRMMALLGKTPPGHPLSGPSKPSYMAKGYERIKEDLSWRGKTGANVPHEPQQTGPVRHV